MAAKPKQEPDAVLGKALARLDAAKPAEDALRKIATLDQDDRPLPGSGWDDPFDWRRRSMEQERIAREAYAAKPAAESEAGVEGFSDMDGEQEGGA